MKFVGLLTIMVAVVAGLTAGYLYFYSRPSIPDPKVQALQQAGLNPSDPQAVNEFFHMIDTSSSSASLPDELSVNFDPTKNPAVFRVMTIDSATGIFQLSGMSPEAMRGKNFPAKITCPSWDLKVTPVGKIQGQYVFPGQLIATIGSLDNTTVIVSGICKDSSCNDINSACQVSIFAGSTK